MGIKISCPNCDRKYNLADTMAGKTIRCKDCEKQFRVDDPHAEDSLMSEADGRRKRSALGARSGKADFDDDEDEADRPQRSNRGVLFMIACGGALAILLLPVVIVLLVPSAPLQA